MFAGGKNLGRKGPRRELNISFEKNVEECFICSHPPDEKWCVFLDCGHQSHKKCFNQWTGHARVNYYKGQTTHDPIHMETNARSCPMCRIEYGIDDLMLWSDYEKAKKKQLKNIKREKRIQLRNLKTNLTPSPQKNQVNKI